MLGRFFRNGWAASCSGLRLGRLRWLVELGNRKPEAGSRQRRRVDERACDDDDDDTEEKDAGKTPPKDAAEPPTQLPPAVDVTYGDCPECSTPVEAASSASGT